MTAAGGIGASVVQELPPRYGDQPALGIPGWLLRPRPEGFDQGTVHRVLASREVCSAADEDSDDPGCVNLDLPLVDAAGVQCSPIP